MKKKVLLPLIPALMILGSCAGNAPQAKEQLFQEDTLLHDEVFGNAASLFGKAKRNALPEDDSSAVPVVGVQKAVGDTTVSIRFVAATNLDKDDLDDTEAVWTRTMYDASGSVFKVAAEKPSLLTYTALRDGSGTRYTIDDFNTQYNTSYSSFVVYTMLNIPKTTYDDYYLNAYLTLTPNGEESTCSQTLATNVSGTQRISFPHDADGYFLKGTLNGNAGTFLPQEASIPEGKNARFVFSNFKANDAFFIGYNHIDATPANSKFNILDSSCLVPWNPYFVGDGTDANKIKVTTTHEYSFNISATNHLIDIENGYTVTYTNTSDVLVTVPLTFGGYDGENKQFTANITPQSDSIVVFKYDGNVLSSVEAEEGANIEEDGGDLKIITGGSEIEVYLKETGDDSHSVWVNYPKVTVNVYIKGWGENKSDFWEPTDGVYVYAHVYTEIEKLYYSAEYVATYDNGYTVHYHVEMPANIASGHSLLMIRGPESEVPEVPTSWPEGHIYNQTNGAAINDSTYSVDTWIP